MNSAPAPRLIRVFINAFRYSAKPNIFTYLLLWLMLLLITGTISEKYIGLYQAQKIYFSSWIIWLGGVVPVPGARAVLLVISICLISKLISDSWNIRKIGTLIVHCGALVLFVGGFLTALFSTEGYMAVSEGQSSSYVSDYHNYELAFLDPSHTSSKIFDQGLMVPGQLLPQKELPFKMIINAYFDNSAVHQRDTPITDGTVHGMLVANEMVAAPRLPIDEQNHPGIIFTLIGAGPDLDGQYAIFENMAINQHLVVNGVRYLVTLRHSERTLPFQIKLQKFTEDKYPGTDKPQSFKSDVILTDGKLEWRSLISMNQPLRYKGFTIYQSSFFEENGQPVSVLTVVQDIGSIFPYLASLILCSGLFFHLFLRLSQLSNQHTKSTGRAS